MSIVRNLVLAALVGITAPLSSGCYGYVEPAAYGYEPLYYDGYVVYYDDFGRPFYYSNGVAVFISPTAPLYGNYVHHYRVYGPSYGRWYAHHGYRYRTYRAAPGRVYRAPGYHR